MELTQGALRAPLLEMRRLRPLQGPPRSPSSRIVDGGGEDKGVEGARARLPPTMEHVSDEGTWKVRKRPLDAPLSTVWPDGSSYSVEVSW